MITDVTADLLRSKLELADAGVLVAVLAQLTGDVGVVDRFAARISYVPDPPEQAGVTDPETAAALVDAVIAALDSPRPAGALPADDPALFARVAPLALGSEVGDGVRRAVARAGRVPAVAADAAAHRAAARGLQGRHHRRRDRGNGGGAGMRRCWSRFRDHRPQRRGRRHLATPPSIRASAWTPRRRTTRCRATSTPTGRATTRRAAEYQAYLVSVADKNELRERTRFGTEVEALWWDEDRKQWQIHAVGRRRHPRGQLRQRRGPRGRLPEPAALARARRAGTPSPASASTPRSGIRPWI